MTYFPALTDEETAGVLGDWCYRQHYQVQVYVTRIEQPGADGKLHVLWDGALPLRWRNQEFSPLMRTIGAAWDADLFSITQAGDPAVAKGVELLSIHAPFNCPTKFKTPGDNERDMARHLAVSELATID